MMVSPPHFFLGRNVLIILSVMINPFPAAFLNWAIGDEL